MCNIRPAIHCGSWFFDIDVSDSREKQNGAIVLANKNCKKSLLSYMPDSAHFSSVSTLFIFTSFKLNSFAI
jgi:hypothetical protein